MSSRVRPPSSSRSNPGRERNEKPLASNTPSSRPGPFTRGGSSKELLENQTQEETRREREDKPEPPRPSVTEDKPDAERSRVREPGERNCDWPSVSNGAPSAPPPQTCFGSVTLNQLFIFLIFVSFTPTVKPEPVQIPSRPALSEEEVERKSKSIIDEFLHINDYKVLSWMRFTAEPFRGTLNTCNVNDGFRLLLTSAKFETRGSFKFCVSSNSL